MAAGQQRKRSTSSNSHELQGKKKKRLDLSDYILNLRSHVHLQWDDVQKRVVAKREQVGITWKEMSSYVDSVPKFHSGLADVFSFPKEVFDLDNLMEVLSHKVWLTYLSASERKLLMQFLPSCAFAEQAVQSLLTGENLHFGNPFLKWSNLLCSSDLHPDILLQKERKIRISKKQYNLEINKYHTNMVAVLRMLKEKSETCEDPEKLWRKLSSPNNIGEGVGDEKPNDYSIEKQLPMKMFDRYVDEAKCMSDIKVNKKQFKRLKELKHSGDHIQSESISRVLGDIKNFHIYPYKPYEDEENNKLRKHWMQVTKDTLAAFETHNKWKLLKKQQMECLEKELTESRTFIHDKAEESVLGNSPEHHIEVAGQTDHHSIATTDEEDPSSSCSISARHHMSELLPSLDVLQELKSPFSDLEIRVPKPAEDAPVLISPSKSTWISANSQETHLFASSDVPLSQCQHFKARPAPIIDLQGEMERAATQLRPAAFNVEATSQTFSSYGQVHSEAITTFPMASEMLSSRMNDSRNAREKELHMQNTIYKNFSADNARHNPVRFGPSSSSRCTLQGGHSWFPNEHQSLNVWSGNDFRSGGANGSLLSILPEFRDSSCRSSFDASGSEQLSQARSSVGASMADSYVATQASGPTGLASAPVPSMDMMWMNYFHQNPSTHQESVRKPLMKHWHQ